MSTHRTTKKRSSISARLNVKFKIYMHVVYNLIIINFFFSYNISFTIGTKNKSKHYIEKKKEEERERYAQKLNEDDFEAKF